MEEVNIDTVNAAIEALVASPQVDYTIGEKTVKAGQIMDQLLKVKKQLTDNPAADINIMAFDFLDINEFGIDNSQEIS